MTQTDITEEQIAAALKAASDNQIMAQVEARELDEEYYETAYDEAYDSVDKAVAMIRGGDIEGGLLFIERTVRPKFGSKGASMHAYEQEIRRVL